MKATEIIKTIKGALDLARRLVIANEEMVKLYKEHIAYSRAHYLFAAKKYEIALELLKQASLRNMMENYRWITGLINDSYLCDKIGIGKEAFNKIADHTKMLLVDYLEVDPDSVNIGYYDAITELRVARINLNKEETKEQAIQLQKVGKELVKQLQVHQKNTVTTNKPEE